MCMHACILCCTSFFLQSPSIHFFCCFTLRFVGCCCCGFGLQCWVLDVELGMVEVRVVEVLY